MILSAVAFNMVAHFHSDELRDMEGKRHLGDNFFQDDTKACCWKTWCYNIPFMTYYHCVKF